MKINKTCNFIFVFFVISCYSQSSISKFQDKINFSLLNEIVKMSNDTITVNNLSADKHLFYFYNTKTNNKIIPNGYEIAYPFVGETAIVLCDNGWALINRSGKFIYKSKTYSTVKLSSYEKYAIFEDRNGVKEIYNLRDGVKQSGFIYCAEPASPDFFVQKTRSDKYELVKSKDNKSVFKEEMDSIIPRNNLIYGDSNLIILKQKNKYGLYISNGNELLKIKYKKIKFLGNYIMVSENKKWNYYNFENNKLNPVTSTAIECQTAAYQNNVIGAFINDNKYNLLKTNSKILVKGFDYISSEATFGIEGNSVVIFDSKGNFYNYYNK